MDVATIATIIGIVSATVTIAQKISEWYLSYRAAKKTDPTSPRIEKVLIVTDSGKRLLLKDASVEDIQKILEEST